MHKVIIIIHSSDLTLLNIEELTDGMMNEMFKSGIRCLENY